MLPPGGSSSTGMESVDGEGNSLTLTLERKSVQPYATQDEYLYAMKEDLAEWFNTLYNSELCEEGFFEQLDTGVLLCQHANNVNSHIIGQTENGLKAGYSPRSSQDLQELARQVIQYKTNAAPGTFHARDNISNFISWCRWTLAIPDTLLFESEDLVTLKNERNVVLCLLEVARRGARYGMLAPVLIQLEVEIDAEIAGEEPPPPPPRPRRTIDLMSLDEMVREIAKMCTCPDQFPIVRVSEGKYKVGESQTLIFVRILRNHVMVRIGGGWDTLQNYLNRHDPCRCHGGKSHKSRRYNQTSGASPAKRRSSMPSPAPSQASEGTTRPGRQLPATPPSADHTHDSVNPGASPRAKSATVVRRNSSVTSRNVERVRNSDESPLPRSANQASRPQSPAQQRANQRPQSPAGRPYSRPQSPSVTRRAQSPAPRARPQSPAPRARPQSPAQSFNRPSSPSLGRRTPVGTQRAQSPSPLTQERKLSTVRQGLHKRFDSNSDLSASGPASTKPDVVRPQPKRPASAGPTAHSRTLSNEVVPVTDRTLNSEVASLTGRGKSPSRESKPARHVRSRSVGATELQKHMIIKTSTSDNQEVLMISRNKDGGHVVNMPGMNGTGPTSNNRGLSSVKANMNPHKLLPSKPKALIRTKSLDVREQTEDSGGSSLSINSVVTDKPIPKPGLKRQSSVGSLGAFGSTTDLTDLPPPPAANRELNAQMELLFQEYRKMEKGWFHCDDPELQDNSDLLGSSSSSLSTSGSAPKSKRPASAGVRSTGPPQGVSRSSGREAPTFNRRASLSNSSSSSSLSSSASRARPSTPSSTSSSTTGRIRPSTPTSQRQAIVPASRPAPATPTAQRRTTTPLARPTPIRPTPVYPRTEAPQPDKQDSPSSYSTKQTNSSNITQSASTQGSQVRRSSSMRRDGSVPRYRSQTPSAEPSTPQVQPRARSKTPLVHMKEEAKPRIDTGLKNRPTTPLSVHRPGATPQARVQRSSSMSRAAINRTITKQDPQASAGKLRSKSREDLLDDAPSESLFRNQQRQPSRTRARSREDLLDGAATERQSRSDTTRKRDRMDSTGNRTPVNNNTHNSQGLSNGDVYTGGASYGAESFRDPPRSLPPTPGMLNTAPPPEPVTVDIPSEPAEIKLPGQRDESLLANTRKDDRGGPRTRIPRPASARSYRTPAHDLGGLKRCDSGVDINISPNENSSIQGDDDMCIPWQQHPQSYSVTRDNVHSAYDEYY